GQHVSPAVVDRLLATQTDPPSEMREVCVLFLDIRGFTAMSRKRPADQTVALLNDFFAEMVEIVDRHHGIVNKFLGDGFLALFGAPLEDPKAADNALASARAMLTAVDDWNRRRPDRTMRVGIGIHTGQAVTGTVGSPQRKEYTVIGDTVNLAARLEQLTKDTGARLLVSSSVHDAASGADGAADLGPLEVRGYDEAVRVWRGGRGGAFPPAPTQSRPARSPGARPPRGGRAGGGGGGRPHDGGAPPLTTTPP